MPNDAFIPRLLLTRNIMQHSSYSWWHVIQVSGGTIYEFAAKAVQAPGLN